MLGYLVGVKDEVFVGIGDCESQVAVVDHVLHGEHLQFLRISERFNNLYSRAAQQQLQHCSSCSTAHKQEIMVSNLPVC